MWLTHYIRSAHIYLIAVQHLSMTSLFYTCRITYYVNKYFSTQSICANVVYSRKFCKVNMVGLLKGTVRLCSILPMKWGRDGFSTPRLLSVIWCFRERTYFCPSLFLQSQRDCSWKSGWGQANWCGSYIHFVVWLQGLPTPAIFTPLEPPWRPFLNIHYSPDN